MPRTTEEILAHAGELARRFEETEPDPERIRDATTLRELARAFERRARAEADLASAVATARADGHTWAAIGAMLGTSGEAARQRYGSAAPAAPPRKSPAKRMAGTVRGQRMREILKSAPGASKAASAGRGAQRKPRRRADA